MIKSVKIKNFKSIVNLSLELGTFNVLIGENGCGKSNVLEAIGFGAAAGADKLDFEFLGSRGIRVTNPEFMFSAFKDIKNSKKIEIEFNTTNELFESYSYLLSNDSNNPRKWINESKENLKNGLGKALIQAFFDENLEEQILLKTGLDDADYSKIEKYAISIKQFAKEKGIQDQAKEFFEFIFNERFLRERFGDDDISNYIIYAPEQSSLRKFEETTQIYPLGIRGEGLFQYLKELVTDKKNIKTLNKIKEALNMLDWYRDFDLPESSLKKEVSLKIKDRYLDENLQFFDQRSTNEGFLFLLFYSVLFISKSTPHFFAIDNLDTSLNPKLCMELTRCLSNLSQKYKKQVIATTQNPAILDGLNLKDDNQRLFVISRNQDGHTRAERIFFNQDRNMKLSEVWTKGFIGGLPSNF